MPVHELEKTERWVLDQLFNRYYGKALILDDIDWVGVPESCLPSKLRGLLVEAITNGAKYPLDKLHRWLGFIQGVLAMKGVICVEAERNFTRPLLHSFHTDAIPSFSV